MSEYPEHEKMLAVKEESQAIGEFLEYSGYVLMKHDHGYGGEIVPAPVMDSIEVILAEYFDIDLTKIEAERRQMLEALNE